MPDLASKPTDLPTWVAASSDPGRAVPGCLLCFCPVYGFASFAASGEGTQNLMCAAQAAGALIALVALAVWPGGWPIDPIIAFGIAAWSAWEGDRR
jgi:hypothetical protein